MGKRAFRQLVTLIGLFFAGAAFCQEGAPERFVRVAQRIVDAYNAADYERITREFNESMLVGLPPVKAKSFFEGLASKMGKIQRLDNPRVTPPDRILVRCHFERGTLDMRLILDSNDKVGGLGFLPEEKPPAVSDREPPRNQSRLRLPFQGRWLVSAGGDTRELNSHHDVPNQVFAFDFRGVGPDGKTYSGGGQRNEDHSAFGREILATADGTVTDVIEGVRDNTPGSLNPYSALGNAVLIEHRPGEVSVFAHLKLGSTRVKVGDRVKVGQVIGLCGNSGNSKAPHLHYHLQDTSIIQDGRGIKIFFENVNVRRESSEDRKDLYSPVREDVISPVAVWPAG